MKELNVFQLFEYSKSARLLKNTAFGSHVDISICKSHFSVWVLSSDICDLMLGHKAEKKKKMEKRANSASVGRTQTDLIPEIKNQEIQR